MLSNPLSVLSIETEGYAIFQKSRRVCRHPSFFRARQHGLFDGSQPFRAPRHTSRIFLVCCFPTFFGLTVRKCCIGLRRDVAKVAQNIHHLVVAKQGYDPPPVCRGFFLEAHEQVHCFTPFLAAIEKVSRLNQCSVSASPMILVIHQACAFENEREIIKIDMDIADRDESRCRLIGRCCGIRRRKTNTNQKEDQSGADSTQKDPGCSAYHLSGLSPREQICFVVKVRRRHAPYLPRTSAC